MGPALNGLEPEYKAGAPLLQIPSPQRKQSRRRSKGGAVALFFGVPEPGAIAAPLSEPTPRR